MVATDTFIPTPRQLEALQLMRTAPNVMLFGGSSAGKTRLWCEFFADAAVTFRGIRFLFARFRRQHAADTLWHETLKGEVLSRYPRQSYTLNEKDLYVTFANGSEIWVTGTDDKERIEKTLGRGVAGIYLNEASQISYEAYTLMRTRLRQNIPGWRAIVAADENPPAPSHWTHKVFIEHVEPKDNRPLEASRYVSLLMNPDHNREHLPPEYIDSLDELPEHERRRFKLGEFVRPAGIVFGDFTEASLVDEAPECEQYVVGLDMVTYAAVLIGLRRERVDGKVRRVAYAADEWGRQGAIAGDADTAIYDRWATTYRYQAIIDHNLGEAGTREIRRSRLAKKGPGSLEAGVALVQRMFRAGTLKVARKCGMLRYELENYRRDEYGVLVQEDDHHIAGLRMALFTVIGGQQAIRVY